MFVEYIKNSIIKIEVVYFKFLSFESYVLAKKYYLDAHCDKNSLQKVTLVFPFFCNTVVYPLPCGGYRKDFRNILSEVNFLNITKFIRW